MNAKHRNVIRVTDRAALLALIPHLLGFAPSDSLVVIYLDHKRVACTARIDLPDLDEDPSDLLDPLIRLAAIAVREQTTAMILIGYGQPEPVHRVLTAAIAVFGLCDLRIDDEIRVTDGRYFGHGCDRDCCPREGSPLPPTNHPAAVQAVVAGQVALPDRAALAASIAPVDESAQLAMRRATDAALRRLANLIDTGTKRYVALEMLATLMADLPEAAQTLLRDAGQTAVRQAFDRYRVGRRLADDEAAWLTLLLARQEIRDLAWAATDGQAEHQAMWSDLTRRAVPELVAAPAALLAFAAWRDGNGALAAIAADRALDVNPDYAMARLLRRALQEGIPPSLVDGWPDSVFRRRRPATD
jgi:hypothetical protein